METNLKARMLHANPIFMTGGAGFIRLDADSFTEVPALAEFWPVVVENLLPEIQDALGGYSCCA